MNEMCYSYILLYADVNHHVLHLKLVLYMSYKIAMNITICSRTSPHLIRYLNHTTHKSVLMFKQLFVRVHPTKWFGVF